MRTCSLWMDAVIFKVLHRHAALDQLAAQHIDERIVAHLPLGFDLDDRVGAIEVVEDMRALEVETLGDLFLRLIHGVVHFLQITIRGDVERIR